MPVLQQYHNIYPQQYSIPGPPFVQQPTDSYLQPGHFPHHASAPSPQLSEAFLASQRNSIPFPSEALRDATAATVNLSQRNQPTTTAKSKRKRKDASTSDPAPKRARKSVNAATATPSTIPIETASIVGVGPVPEPLPTLCPAPTSSSDTTAAPGQLSNPTYVAISQTVNRIASSGRHGAADVWYFVKPMDTDERPDEMVEETDLAKPLITQKPKSRFVGCRLCKYVFCVRTYIHRRLIFCPREWHKPWANTSGGITTTLRRHFESEHGNIYRSLLKQLKLRPERIQDVTDEEDDEPFSVERWTQLLIDWVVVDDQVFVFRNDADFCTDLILSP